MPPKCLFQQRRPDLGRRSPRDAAPSSDESPSLASRSTPDDSTVWPPREIAWTIATVEAARRRRHCSAGKNRRRRRRNPRPSGAGRSSSSRALEAPILGTLSVAGGGGNSPHRAGARSIGLAERLSWQRSSCWRPIWHRRRANASRCRQYASPGGPPEASHSSDARWRRKAARRSADAICLKNRTRAFF
eukprot:scaffold214168_cov30-Tisochrysis_lutea.AAC.2